MSRHRESVIDRWLRYVGVSKCDSAEMCWPWTGAVDSRGYPRFYDGERQVDAARWYWERINNAVANGVRFKRCKELRHCVNPTHLEPRSDSDGNNT